MTAFIRFLFTVLSALAFLLCVAVLLAGMDESSGLVHQASNIAVWFCAVALTAILPARWIQRFITRVRWRNVYRRLDAGLCPYCRYDLRASWIQCPECGNLIPLGIARP